MGIIDDLGIIAISSRLKRLSDTFLKDAALIYKKYDANFMFKWYPAINALSKKSPLSLTELATGLNYMHPSVIELINEMEEQKLVKSSADKKDRRKRMISLTPKSKALIEEIQPFIEAFVAVLKKLSVENNIMKAIEEIEEKLEERSFFKRVDDVLKYKKTGLIVNPGAIRQKN